VPTCPEAFHVDTNRSIEGERPFAEKPAKAVASIIKPNVYETATACLELLERILADVERRRYGA
jgi:hypothetical protein